MHVPAVILKRAFLLTSFSLCLVVSCIPPAHDPPPNPFLVDLKQDTDIEETGHALPYFTTYVESMSRLGLSSIFREEGPYTIFIPRQEAFARFLKENNLTSVKEIPDDLLKTILLHHIISGKWMTFELKNGYYPTKALEKSSGNPIDLYISKTSVLQVNGDPSFGTSDIESDNGIIHSMISVIKLPDLYTHLSINPEFSSMLRLVKRLDPESSQFKMLTDEGPLTLFVPDNQAFESFLDTNASYHSIEDVPSTMAEKIIIHHLIPDSNVVLTNQYKNLRLTDKSDKTIEISVDGKSISINDGQDNLIQVTNADIQAVNGIIHQVDQLILPE